jgi:glycosyltransferase involved in cell wall biosynthesis
MRRFRIAFLTPEFITELTSAGGLGAYLNRMADALRDAGHLPEIITLSDHASQTLSFHGFEVHRVQRTHLTTRAWQYFLRKYEHDKPPWLYLGNHLAGAWLLARHLKRLQSARNYEIVQSSDYGFTGLFVPRHHGRTHVVRCSWVGELFMKTDGTFHPFTVRAVGRIERLCLRKADRAYAPSRFVADYYRHHHGLEVDVLRPPLGDMPPGGPAEACPDFRAPDNLPAKFLLHFGQLRERKGTDIVAAALPLVWAQVPDFRMVWAGQEESWRILARSQALWGEDAAKVTYLGALDRPQMLATIRRATATVLPSRVDNLPNTAIESLALGVPVIGSAGASIDELVEDGVNGYLVPIGDASALAEAKIRVWNLPPNVLCQRPAMLDDMIPSRAVTQFLELVAATTPSHR